MKSKIQNIFWYIILVVLFVPRFFVRADPPEGGSKDVPPEGGSGDNTISIEFDNPIETDTLAGFLEKVLDIILTIGIPIVAVFIIYSGFLFVTARGNAEKLKEAKQTFFYTMIGAAILLGAWVLAQAISGTIDQFRT